jgi:hypothetical protein
MRECIGKRLLSELLLQMPEKKIVKKMVLGINTRFAVSNPFDPR